jgi:pyruvate/2-oxoglutarate dehydrogenase complex dihydrolipoamide dehydrogenase (E3) component
MTSKVSTAVIGAGPYGLSVAAHLRAAGVGTRVLGFPMEFWRAMPRQMFLKSPWSASSLSDPRRLFSLDRYVSSRSEPRVQPVPLPMFLDYADWFRENAVGEVDEVRVRRLSSDNGNFRVELDHGQVFAADRVVVAAGISDFGHIPAYARDLPPMLASHTQVHGDLGRFRGASVAVVGTGQSGLETAALLAEAGADVELLVRGPVRWVYRKYSEQPILKQLLYPPSDVGPVGLNWLVSFPSVFRHLPDESRWRLTVRAIRPSGAKWLRSRFEAGVRATPFTEILAACENGDQLTLSLSDGTSRQVDHLFLGTGFNPDVARLPLLDPQLRSRLRTARGHPVLDRGLESSVPKLHFAGALAGYTFGPLCRFVAGADASARRIAQRAVSGAS